MTILVFGSINMDLVARTPRLPAAGETILGTQFATVPGGKGANQAVACARLGGATRMFGRVSGDVFGAALLQALRADNVDVTGVTTTVGTSSGVAIIAVDDAAQNNIIVVPGANAAVDAADVLHLQHATANARVLLLQLEVPMPAVLAAARAAHTAGLTVILDPAPAAVLPAELYPLIDVLTPNEVEARMLVGFELDTPHAIERAARLLTERGVGRVVIKLGERGAYFVDGESSAALPAFKVTAIDTVAAGDAFNGGLAAALAAGRPFADALRWAMAAGALCTTKRGAQDAMPERAAVEMLLAQQPTAAA